MAETITVAQAESAALYAQFLTTYVESEERSENTPLNTPKRTITGINEDVDAMLAQAAVDLDTVVDTYDAALGGYVTTATDAAQQAQASEDNIEVLVQSVSSVQDEVDLINGYKVDAEAASVTAVASAISASESLSEVEVLVASTGSIQEEVDLVETYRDEASVSAQAAATSEIQALNYKLSSEQAQVASAESEVNAKASEDAAAISSQAAIDAVNLIGTSVTEAAESAQEAKDAETNIEALVQSVSSVQDEVDLVEGYKNSAEASAQSASTSEANVSANTILSQGYKDDSETAANQAESSYQATLLLKGDVETLKSDTTTLNTQTEGYRDETLSYKDTTETYKSEAQEAATETEGFATTAFSSMETAVEAKDAAELAVASVNLPPIQAGDVEKILQVNSTEDGYELVEQVSPLTAEQETTLTNTIVSNSVAIGTNAVAEVNDIKVVSGTGALTYDASEKTWDLSNTTLDSTFTVNGEDFSGLPEIPSGSEGKLIRVNAAGDGYELVSDETKEYLLPSGVNVAGIYTLPSSHTWDDYTELKVAISLNEAVAGVGAVFSTFTIDKEVFQATPINTPTDAYYILVSDDIGIKKLSEVSFEIENFGDAQYVESFIGELEDGVELTDSPYLTAAQNILDECEIIEANVNTVADSLNLPVIQSGDEGKILTVNSSEDGYELVEEGTRATFNITSIASEIEGVSDLKLMRTGNLVQASWFHQGALTLDATETLFNIPEGYKPFFQIIQMVGNGGTFNFNQTVDIRTTGVVMPVLFDSTSVNLFTLNVTWYTLDTFV